MIDNGNCFDGDHWDFPDSPIRGLYPNHSIYREDIKLISLEPWLKRTLGIRVRRSVKNQARIMEGKVEMGKSWGKIHG